MEFIDSMGYSLNLGAWNKVFAVPSCVVEKYLKLAGGGNIKVLLYYLNNAGKPMSCEEISKATGVKVEDCEDALNFWTEAGILAVNDNDEFESGSEIIPSQNNETRLNVIHDTESKNVISEYSVKKIKLERSTEFYPHDIADAVKENKELDFLFDHCEKLYGRPLKHVERNMLMLLTEEIEIPIECAVMLIDYCHSINKATPAYIKAIAADWMAREIISVEKVEAEIRRITICTERETELKKLFEMNNGFSKKQKEMIEKWSVNYGFSTEMIEEAYQRTLDGVSKLSFPYMNKILEDWYDRGIKRVEKLTETDTKRKTENKEAAESSFDIDEITRASMEKYNS